MEGATIIRQVLLVEGDSGMREAIRALLERAGYSVAMARDGAEGVGLSRGPRPVAILADLYTPRMTGHDLARCVRRTPRLARVPIIAMTGERASKTRPAVEAFLEKPLSREQLEWALQRVGAARSLVLDLPQTPAAQLAVIARRAARARSPPEAPPARRRPRAAAGRSRQRSTAGSAERRPEAGEPRSPTAGRTRRAPGSARRAATRSRAWW